MAVNHRMERITEIVQKEKNVTVNYLSKKLGVTEKTIRLDLEKLEKTNVLIRVHGGAICNDKSISVYPNREYRGKFSLAKKEIAKTALSLIEPNDIILLDDGTTTLELAKLLGDFPVTVLTNDITIFNELISKDLINLYIVGGALRRDGNSLIISGDDAVQFIKKFRVNKLFLGVSTIDKDNGLMIFHYGDKTIKRAFMSIANEIICLAVSAKFNQTAFTNFADIDEIDKIITDSKLDYTVLEDYKNANIQVMVSDEYKE